MGNKNIRKETKKKKKAVVDKPVPSIISSVIKPEEPKIINEKKEV